MIVAMDPKRNAQHHDEISLTEFQFEKVCFLEILENMILNDIVFSKFSISSI
jgi:hypothetical protein